MGGGDGRIVEWWWCGRRCPVEMATSRVERDSGERRGGTLTVEWEFPVGSGSDDVPAAVADMVVVFRAFGRCGGGSIGVFEEGKNEARRFGEMRATSSSGTSRW
jgi:hypothetical protein